MTPNITIYPFKFKHFDQLIEILNSNNYVGVSLIEMKTLPKVGYIALLDGKIPIAAGFLRRLEPCFAQIDTLCSNKYYGSIIRHKGIELVVDSLLVDAKALKLKGVFGLTTDKGVLDRAKVLGFHIINETLIGLSIK